MANKLWLILMAVSAMTSLSSQIDLSGMMGLGGFGSTKEDLTKTTTTQAPNYNNNNYNNNPTQNPNIFANKPIDKLFPGKPFQLQDKFEKEKFDKLENKFQKDKTNNDNYRQQYSQPSSNYSVIKVAAPVENPIYSTYNSGITPPTLDDGSYVQIPTNYGSNQYINTQHRTGQSSAQHRPSNSQSYGNKNNFTGFNVYRQLYGYNQGNGYNRNNYGNMPNAGFNYGQIPARTPTRYGQQSNHYESQTPYRGNAPIYSGNYGYNPNEHQILNPVYDTGYHEEQSYHAPEQSYHAPEQSYHAPEQSYYTPEQSYHGPDQSYNSGYNPQPIDLSQYISPMPYTELSEYMSPAQYNNYAERLYSTYNVPYPSPKPYDNYNNYSKNNNYGKEFQMVVAVVVLNAQTNYNNAGSYANQGSYQGSQGSYAQSGYQAAEPFKDKFSQDKFGQQSGYDAQQAGYGSQQGVYGNQQTGYVNQQGGNVKGTLFISEINPYVCLVSGVVTGLKAYGKFGIAIHRFGDLTNGCKSIGEHYNPTHKNHGNLNHIQSHVGDLGNIGADANGIAFVNKISKNQFSINNRNPVAGRAIGICQNQDDLGLGGNVESLKNGNCGTIQACGIIGLANTGASDTKHY